ncbi:uncharacterized protein LOC111125859 isoform X2 [Crassostrea virginica]
MSLHKRVTNSNYVCFAFMLFTVVSNVNVSASQNVSTTPGLTTTSELSTPSTPTTYITTTSDDSTTMSMNSENTTTEMSTLESTSAMSTETTSDVTTTPATSLTSTTGTETTPENTGDPNSNTTTENTNLSTTTNPDNASASTDATSTTGSPTTVNSSNEMTTTTTIDLNNSTQDTTTVESYTGTTSQSSVTVTGDSVLTTTESLGSTTESGLNDTSAPTVMEPNMTSTVTSVEPTAMTETTNTTTGSTGTTPITLTIEGVITESSSPETSTQQSSTTIATTTTTTTTKRTTTTSYQVEPIYPDIENAVLDFTFELKFTECGLNKSTIENRLADVSNTVDECKYIRVKTINSCVSGRRKRSTSSTQVSVEFGIDAQAGTSGASNVSDDLYFSLSTVHGIDVAYLNETKVNLTVALASQEICDAEVCRSAVIGRPGFVCVSESSQNNTQRCKILYYCDYKPMDCGNSGQCYVETDIRPGNVSYTSKCRCTKTDYFRYEGTFCTEKVMTWELAVIISISASGALILVLLFIIIILCCRNATNSGDVFEESELMYTQSGNANSNQYKNGGNSGDSLKGVENRGYMEVRERPNSGSNWKPEDSANTYASIESKLRESNYNIQIKRPQVAQYKKTDEITEF